MTRPRLPSIAITSPSDSSVSPAFTVFVLEVDVELARARHARLAHAAGDERRVAGLAALGREDALGGVEAADVVGLGERAHEDHVAAVLGGLDGVVGGEDDLALGGARRGGDALGDHVEVGVGVESRVQQRVERARRRS